MRFAHCDRLDLDRHIAPSHRLHCWREWRRVYTYGQTRDRVDYAQRRIAVLVSGDTSQPYGLPSPGSQAAATSCPEVCEALRVRCTSECSTAASGCDQCEEQDASCKLGCL